MWMAQQPKALLLCLCCPAHSLMSVQPSGPNPRPSEPLGHLPSRRRSGPCTWPFGKHPPLGTSLQVLPSAECASGRVLNRPSPAVLHKQRVDQSNSVGAFPTPLLYYI